LGGNNRGHGSVGASHFPQNSITPLRAEQIMGKGNNSKQNDKKNLKPKKDAKKKDAAAAPKK
jgi:hypothetical protein